MGGVGAGGVDERLDAEFITHKDWLAEDKDALVAKVAANIRGIATTGNHGASAALIDALPKLEIISCFGVGPLVARPRQVVQLAPLAGEVVAARHQRATRRAAST